MTTPISSVDLLHSTVYLASLARRAALASNDPTAREQALKLAPVAQELKKLARDAGPTAAGPTPVAAQLPAVGAVSAPDFQVLMDAAAKKRDPAAALMNDSLDRTTVALSMARGGANPVEIAKSLGLTRGEVDLIVNIADQK